MEIEKITSIIPEAEISQTGETVVKVPAEKLHQIAETLLNDKENPMDYKQSSADRAFATNERFSSLPQREAAGLHFALLSCFSQCQ